MDIIASEQQQPSIDLSSVKRMPGPRMRLMGWISLHGAHLRRAGLWRTYDAREAFAGACDTEMRQLTAPGARLDANAVRWDLMNAATSGRRCRI